MAICLQTAPNIEATFHLKWRLVGIFHFDIKNRSGEAKFILRVYEMYTTHYIRQILDTITAQKKNPDANI